MCRIELPSKHTSQMEDNLRGDPLCQRHRKWPSAKPRHVKVVHELRSNLRQTVQTMSKNVRNQGYRATSLAGTKEG